MDFFPVLQEEPRENLDMEFCSSSVLEFAHKSMGPFEGINDDFYDPVIILKNKDVYSLNIKCALLNNLTST